MKSSGNVDHLENLLTRKPGATRKAKHCEWHPPGDLKQTATQYTVFIDLPGIDEDELLIEFRGETLSVSGERDFDHDREDAEEFSKIERPYGPFLFEAELAGPFDSTNVKARYRRGVLKVTIPRAATPLSNAIEVD